MNKPITVKQINDDAYEELQKGYSIGGSTHIGYQWALFQNLEIQEGFSYSVYFGQALHTATFEPEKFAQYTNKSKLKEVSKSCIEKKELPPYQYFLIKQIATYLRQNMGNFNLGEILGTEQGFVCEDFGIPLRGKFDILSLTEDGVYIITDLKTTSKSKRQLYNVISERYLHQVKLYLFLLQNYLESKKMLYKDIEFQFIFVGNIDRAEPFIRRIRTAITPYTVEEIEELVSIANKCMEKTSVEECEKYLGINVPPIVLDFDLKTEAEFYIQDHDDVIYSHEQEYGVTLEDFEEQFKKSKTKPMPTNSWA